MTEVTRVIVDYVRGIGSIDSGSIARNNSRPPTTDISFGNHRITRLSPGENPDDGANVGQVDSKIENAIEEVIGSFPLATTTNDGLMSHILVVQLLHLGKTVNGLAELKEKSGLVGEILQETSVGDLWIARANNSALTDDITVVNASDGSCQWHRIASSGPIAKWLEVSAWYIDRTSGNDWNSGTSSGAPLKTGAELVRRIGSRVTWSHSVTITIGANGCASLAFAYEFTVTGCLLTIVGTPTTVLSTTVPAGGYVAESSTVPATLTLTGVSSISTYVGQRIRNMSDGKNTVSWVAEANPPERPGVQYAMIGYPEYYDSTGSHTGSFASGDTVRIESLPSIDFLHIEYCGAQNNVPIGSGSPAGPLTSGVIYIDSISSPQAYFRGFSQSTQGNSAVSCDFSKQLIVQDGGAPGGMSFFGCKLGAPGEYAQMVIPMAIACVSFARALNLDNQQCILGHMLAMGAVYAASSYLRIESRSYVMRGDGVGLNIFIGSTLELAALLRISVAGHGIVLYPHTRIRYKVAPSFSTTEGDIVLNPQQVSLPWASVAVWNDGAQSGFTELSDGSGGGSVAGQIRVAVPYLSLSQQVQFSRGTLVGVWGELSAPPDQQTTTSFLIKSESDADTSVIRWSTNSAGHEQFIGTY